MFYVGVITLTRRIPLRTPLVPHGSVTHYRDRIFDDKRHDPYDGKRKYPEPTLCRDCGAVFQHGRWQWASVPRAAHNALCPACRRTRDKLPAGLVTLSGTFFEAHRAELIGLVHNEAEHERAEHPLHRIMRIEEEAHRVKIATTDIHLPQRIGEALKHAYDGELGLEYGEDEYTVRVHWRR